MDAENLVALIIALAVAAFTLYCLFWPENL